MFPEFVDEEEQEEEKEQVAVFEDGLDEGKVFLTQIIADIEEEGDPDEGSEDDLEGKVAVAGNAGQAGDGGNKDSGARDKPTDKDGDFAVFLEEFFEFVNSGVSQKEVFAVLVGKGAAAFFKEEEEDGSANDDAGHGRKQAGDEGKTVLGNEHACVDDGQVAGNGHEQAAFFEHEEDEKGEVAMGGNLVKDISADEAQEVHR